jgi:hypothetical protein
MKRPAFQFYPADWRKDTELQSCSIAARGLWIEILCIAHECEPYGHLTVNGQPMDLSKLARIAGLTVRECTALVKELEDAGVSRRADSGAIYSKRMVDDERIRNARATGGGDGAEHGHKGAEHGSKGGRPRKETGDKKPPLQPPNNPPPSSSTSSSPSPSPSGSTSSLRSDDSARGATLFDPDGIVPKKNWDEFVKMRKKIKAPLTEHAADLVILELKKLQAAGHDPVAVIDQSTRNSWRDVFPIREHRNGTNGHGTSNLIEGTRRAIERAEREAATTSGGDHDRAAGSGLP